MENLEQTVVDAVNASLESASLYYKTKFLMPIVTFNLKGRAAGQVKFPLNQPLEQAEIRFNQLILQAHTQSFIDEVVPHECAHYVVYHLYYAARFKRRQKPKPHGREWQSVMRNVYGIEPRVTHSYDVPATKRKQFSYLCACDDKVHQLSIIRHNKAARGTAKYLCRACGEILKEGASLQVS